MTEVQQIQSYSLVYLQIVHRDEHTIGTRQSQNKLNNECNAFCYIAKSGTCKER
jgi:hypothetical protein